MLNKFQITRSAELESLKLFRDFITDCCEQHNIEKNIVFELKLAVDEACTNIIQHGYKDLNPGSIILSFRIEENRILVRITDFGHVFEPVEKKQPKIEGSLEERDLGGFGLFLIYKTMDNIDYLSSEDGNTLTFTKYF